MENLLIFGDCPSRMGHGAWDTGHGAQSMVSSAEPAPVLDVVTSTPSFGKTLDVSKTSASDITTAWKNCGTYLYSSELTVQPNLFR